MTSPPHLNARVLRAYRQRGVRPPPKLRSMGEQLLIADPPTLLYRAFYAVPKTITAGDGKSVNALLGTTNLLLREIDQHRPRAVVLCFGPDPARHRVELYE